MFKNYPIHPLSLSNHPEIINVWESSVRATHHFLNEIDIQTYKSLIYNSSLNDLQLFGITENNKISGFIGISGKRIQLLFVLPALMGMGIGLSLINYVYQHLGVKEVDVNEQNTQAYDFYKYLGFEVTERNAIDAIGKPFPVLSMKLP